MSVDSSVTKAVADQRFTTARNVLVLATLISLVWYFVGGSIKFIWKTPFLEISPSAATTPLLLGVILLSVLNLAIEWFRLGSELQRRLLHRLEAGIPTSGAFFVSALLLRRQTPSWELWEISPVVYAGSLILGLALGITLPTALWMQTFARSEAEAMLKGLPRVPNAVRAQRMWFWIDAIIILLFAILLLSASRYKSHIYPVILFSIPVILFSIDTFISEFRGKPSRLGMKRILDQHDANYALSWKPDNFPDHSKISEMTVAITADQLDDLRAQLSGGMSPDIRAPFDWTLAMTAAANGDDKMLDVCLEFGANVNLTNSLGRTGLFYAARYGFTGICQKLLEAGANVDFEKPVMDGSPLIAAARNGHLETVELLLEGGADTAIRNAHGKDALECAEEAGFGAVAAAIRRKRLNR